MVTFTLNCKSKIRDDIPIKIKTATSMRNIAANIPENL